MIFIQDLPEEAYAAYLRSDGHVLSVGETVPSRGPVPAPVGGILRHFEKLHFAHDRELGEHRCEICRDELSHGEFWVDTNEARFSIPLLFFHYVDEEPSSLPESGLRGPLSPFARDNP